MIRGPGLDTEQGRGPAREFSLGLDRSGYRPIEQQLVWLGAPVGNVCLFSKMEQPHMRGQ